MKKFLSLCLFGLIFVLTTQGVFAENNTSGTTSTAPLAQNTPTASPHQTGQNGNTLPPSTNITGSNDSTVNAANKLINHLQNQANSTTKQQTTLAGIKTKADALVKNRIDALNKLLTRTQDDKRLTTDEKTSFTSDVQNSISGLNTLQTKIDTDTTVDQVRIDAKQIFTGYRVFAVFEPKMKLLLAIDNLQTLSNKLTALAPQIQSVLDKLKSQGIDTTTKQIAFDDLKTQLTAINTKLTADKSTITAITITSTDPTTTFTRVRTDINTNVRPLFTKIRTDIASMMGTAKTEPKVLQSQKTTAVTPSNQPLVSPTSTPRL